MFGLIRRLFWVLLGAALGVYAVRRLSALAAGGALGERAREFGDLVREGMAEREAELRVALGVDDSADAPAGTTRPTLTPEQARDLLENPMTERDR
ncbi:MAG: hypothetical protein U0Q19_20035 [Kineosporiaceae bacterium]